MENSYLREEARGVLSGNWLMAVVVFAMLIGANIIVGGAIGAIPIIGVIAGFFVAAVFNTGIIHTSFHLIEERKVSLDASLKGLKNWFNTGLSLFLVGIFTFFWSLLFVIPGIIKALSYSQTLYILADDPELTPTQAITRSRELMDGYKMQYAILQLSFIGWAILSILTFGIGFLFLFPYMMITFANFYLKLKTEKGII